MFEVVHKYKGSHVLFATVKPNANHYINLSAYGNIASDLLEKYLENQREDNEDQFAEWDKSLQGATSKTGFSTNHATEDGYIYISTFQNGIGISPEDKIRPGKDVNKEGRIGIKVPTFRSDDDFDTPEDDSDDSYEE